MTEAKFFYFLSRGKGRGVLRAGAIRIVRSAAVEDCPITLVGHEALGKEYALQQWHHAANDLKLNERFAREVSFAADSTEPSNLRERMLEVLGLDPGPSSSLIP